MRWNKDEIGWQLRRKCELLTGLSTIICLQEGIRDPFFQINTELTCQQRGCIVWSRVWRHYRRSLLYNRGAYSKICPTSWPHRLWIVLSIVWSKILTVWTETEETYGELSQFPWLFRRSVEQPWRGSVAFEKTRGCGEGQTLVCMSAAWLGKGSSKKMLMIGYIIYSKFQHYSPTDECICQMHAPCAAQMEGCCTISLRIVISVTQMADDICSKF